MYSADTASTALQSPDYDNNYEGDNNYENDLSVCPEMEQAMLRAQERARAFVTSSTVAKPTKPFVPPLVRNKSNEQIKSSLKVRPGLVRANSEPSNKSVHFSSTNLEDVRSFKRTQSPSAVSRKPKFYSGMSRLSMNDDDVNIHWASDDEDDEDDEDFDDDDDDDDEDDDDDRKSWTLLTPNFSPHAMSRLRATSRPDVYLDNVQLTPDQTELKAIIYARNLAFEKYVALRYSIDGWRSFCESQGVWSSDIRKFDRDAGYDRFDVLVPLDQFVDNVLNTRSLQACVHYVVGTKEIWDNNNGKNYEFFLRNSKLKSTPDSLQTQQKQQFIQQQSRQPQSQQQRQEQKQIQPQQSQQQQSQQQRSSAPKYVRRHSMPDLLSDSLDTDSSDIDSDLLNHTPRLLGLEDDHPPHLLDPETSDEEDNEEPTGYYRLSSTDYLKRVGVRVRKNDDAQKKDPFFGRYSFAASYKAAPKKLTSNYDHAPVYIASHGKIIPATHADELPTEVVALTESEPHRITQKEERKSGPVYDQRLGHTSMVPKLRTEANGKTSSVDIWESESYKDFVSKYCFFTPSRPDPIRDLTAKQPQGLMSSSPSPASPASPASPVSPVSPASLASAVRTPLQSPLYSPIKSPLSSPPSSQLPLSANSHTSMSLQAGFSEPNSPEFGSSEFGSFNGFGVNRLGNGSPRSLNNI